MEGKRRNSWDVSVDSVDEHIRFSESGVPPTLIRFVFIFPTKNIEKHHTTRGVYHVWDPFSERPMISWSQNVKKKPQWRGHHCHGVFCKTELKIFLAGWFHSYGGFLGFLFKSLWFCLNHHRSSIFFWGWICPWNFTIQPLRIPHWPMMETSNGRSSRMQQQDPWRAFWRGPLLMLSHQHVDASGKHTKSDWKWSFIVDLVIQNGDFPKLC